MTTLERLADTRHRNFLDYLCNLTDKERSSKLENLITTKDIADEIESFILEKYINEVEVPVVSVSYNPVNHDFIILIHGKSSPKLSEIMNEFLKCRLVQQDKNTILEYSLNNAVKRYGFSKETLERLEKEH